MRLIDIGVNLTSKQFRHDVDDVIDRAVAAGVARMVVTGTSLDSSHRARELAQTRPHTLWSTAGVHPHNAKELGPERLGGLEALCRQPEVVCVGECGLDYNRNFSPPSKQREAFEWQLELAARVGKPVFLHERDAHEDFASILKNAADQLRDSPLPAAAATSAWRRGPVAFIIGRMIKIYVALLLALGTASCSGERPEEESHRQGIVEYEERHLAFEIGGRLIALDVRRGDALEPQQPVARLDDKLEQTTRAARVSEAEAAEAQTELLRQGARPEQIGALAMRVAAAQASEKRLSQSLARETLLATKGVSTRAVVEDLEQQLANAKATRQSLQQDLAALRKGARSSEIDGAVARAEAARRSVMLGDERIARHQLAAPLGGTVLDVHGEMGEVIAAGTPIITLGDVARPYVDVFVPVGDLERIAVGDKAQVRVDSDDHWFDAHVDWVARTTEFTPRYLFSERERPNLVVRVRLIIDEPDARIHAGVPAFARLGSPS